MAHSSLQVPEIDDFVRTIEKRLTAVHPRLAAMFGQCYSNTIDTTTERLDDGGTFVFTGDIPAVQRRGLAVEPMTCPPNAFRSGEALLTLEPGESHTATWGLSPTIEVRE